MGKRLQGTQDRDHDDGHDHVRPRRSQSAQDREYGHVEGEELLPSIERPPSFNEQEAKQARRLGFVLAFIAVFFIVELGGAVLARSNVLKADALHLLMDLLAIAMSLLAMRVAVRRPTAHFTFGLRRAEPVAAIVNGTLVVVATVEIVRRAILALANQEPPEAGIMLAIAALALVVNGISAWLLHGSHGHRGHAHGDHEHGKGHDLNVRGAKLHLIGDTLGSVAALVAAIIIRLGGPVAADPIASLLVAVVLFIGAGRLLRDAALVLLEAAPAHLPVAPIREAIRGYAGVTGVHDMHVWSLGAGHDAISVHVHTNEKDLGLGPRLAAHLRHAFKVEYVTVQVETDDTCQAPPSLYDDAR
jgi:cation diffusion facilitator family transporter